MKEQFQIKVLGQTLSVLSDAGEEHVGRVVAYVNAKADEIQSRDGRMNTLSVAILAALNIADEYIRYRSVNNHLCSQLESESEKLIDLIDDIGKTARIPCDVRD